MTMIRERSSIVLRHISPSESENSVTIQYKKQSLCGCFDTEPLCGNNLRNDARREHSRENDMKKGVTQRIC